MAKIIVKKHDVITALISHMTNKLKDLLPEEGTEDAMIGEAFGIVKTECRHIDVVAHLKERE